MFLFGFENIWMIVDRMQSYRTQNACICAWRQWNTQMRIFDTSCDILSAIIDQFVYCIRVCNIQFTGEIPNTAEIVQENE